jgi:hypothetical protein
MRNSSGNFPRKNRGNDDVMQPVPYPVLVGGVLRARFGMLRHAEKLLARVARVSPRTAENWLRGQCAPQGEALLHLMAECDELAAEILAEVARRRAPQVQTNQRESTAP